MSLKKKKMNDPDTDESGPTPRSANDKTRLADVRSRKKAGDWSFLVRGPKIWNDLPVHVRVVESVSSFKRLLKTHLFLSKI